MRRSYEWLSCPVTLHSHNLDGILYLRNKKAHSWLLLPVHMMKRSWLFMPHLIFIHRSMLDAVFLARTLVTIWHETCTCCLAIVCWLTLVWSSCVSQQGRSVEHEIIPSLSVVVHSAVSYWHWCRAVTFGMMCFRIHVTTGWVHAWANAATVGSVQ